MHRRCNNDGKWNKRSSKVKLKSRSRGETLVLGRGTGGAHIFDRHLPSARTPPIDCDCMRVRIRETASVYLRFVNEYVS